MTLNHLHTLLSGIETLNETRSKPIHVIFSAIQQDTLDDFAKSIDPHHVQLRLWHEYALATPFQNYEDYLLIIGPDITEDDMVSIFNRWSVFSRAIDHCPRMNVTLVFTDDKYENYQLGTYVYNNICTDVAALITTQTHTPPQLWNVMIEKYQEKARPTVEHRNLISAVGSQVRAPLKSKKI